MAAYSRLLYRVIDHPIDHPSMSVSIPNRSDHTARTHNERETKMATKKGPTTFTVEGKGIFPADMLRYDCCWPVTTNDAIRMVFTAPFSVQKLRQIHLMTNAENRPTVGRWESFGWKVV
jgi:hypothetical protein